VLMKHTLLSIVFLTSIVCFITVPSSCEFIVGSQKNLREQPQTDPYNIYARAPCSIKALNEVPSVPLYSFGKMNPIKPVGDRDLMNSPWPMYSHDARHTGRSPYSTENTTGVEAWKTDVDGPACGGPVIGKDGTIYIGSYDLNAVNPNGTIKWKYHTGHSIACCPAIDENGTIYFGVIYGYHLLYALYPNGTQKWVAGTEGDLESSPAIGPDGTIFVGTEGNTIIAINPDGTRKWTVHTGNVVYSSPAIGPDGTVYCGCHDTYLYAINPNGTVQWKFKTGDWVRVGPCIGDDGTIYCVSLDNYLYAIAPNGTMNWKTIVGGGPSPIVGFDGTIYCGSGSIFAINPDGSTKWTCSIPGNIGGGTPCQASDGTIYIGAGNCIAAVNPDGTPKWQKNIGLYVDSPPAIGADGTVYIGDWGMDPQYIHAFGPNGKLTAKANGPYTGDDIHSINFNGEVLGGAFPYEFHWDFGDGNASTQEDPSHLYPVAGSYKATFTVYDGHGNTSSNTTTVRVTFAPPTIKMLKPTSHIYFMNIPIMLFHENIIIGPITVKIEASQAQFGIRDVQFYINNELQATLTQTPYWWTWTKLSFNFNTQTIMVVAYDNSGNSSCVVQYVIKLF